MEPLGHEPDESLALEADVHPVLHPEGAERLQYEERARSARGLVLGLLVGIASWFALALAVRALGRLLG